MHETKIKKEVAYFMRRLYTRQLTTTSGGNISCRINDNKIAITPSALDKGRLQANQIGILTLEGKNLTPDLKLSIETGMHLAIYKKNPEVNAVVHAHPTMATAFTAMKQNINTNLTAESRAVIGETGWAPYALMGTPELAEIVSETTKKHKVVFMENHGILATGKSLLIAFDRLELIEAAAKMTFMTRVLNDVSEMNKERVKQIDKNFNIQ